MSKQLTVTQFKSKNGSNRAQLATLTSLKLRGIGTSATHEDSPQIRGMLHSVRHLVRVEEA